jgi:hypothetical protein
MGCVVANSDADSEGATVTQTRSPVSFVISRYIQHPCLYRGRKFDLRFLVSLANPEAAPGGSVSCFTLGVYQKWFVRCADHAYSLSEFDDPRKHLTVMQYLDDEAGSVAAGGVAPRGYVSPRQVCEQLGVSEATITGQCHQAILELFSVAISGQVVGDAGENLGIDAQQQGLRCGALYGVDILLEPTPAGDHGSSYSHKPIVLEVNHRPDTRRVLAEDPGFYDELLPLLFTEQGRAGMAPSSNWKMFRRGPG